MKTILKICYITLLIKCIDINAQCQPIVFPNLDPLNGNGGLICLEGSPSPLNDICFENKDGNLNFLYAQNQTFTFQKNARLGVGVNSPQESLDVWGNILSRGHSIKINPTANDALLQGGHPQNGNFIINSMGGGIGKENSSIYFNYAQTYNAGSGGIKIFDGGTSNYAKLWITKGVGNGIEKYGGNFVISPSGGKVIIAEDTYTGLNIPTANYKLIVQNGILTAKVKVAVHNSTQWSDHVFDEKYELKSLEEVEKYIKENKHLPNIPSSEELVKEGLDLGEMQAKQMEKIEELTLYLIEMKKEINALKKENQELKEAITKK